VVGVGAVKVHGPDFLFQKTSFINPQKHTVLSGDAFEGFAVKPEFRSIKF
jgi:hypothetical protein